MKGRWGDAEGEARLVRNVNPPRGAWIVWHSPTNRQNIFYNICLEYEGGNAMTS